MAADTVRTFAHAAVEYLEAGGDGTHLDPLLDYLGKTKLSQIGQAEIEAVAKKLGKGRDGTRKSGATLNRQVYTPISAVLHHAARLRWCSAPVIARPRQPEGRVRHLSPEEAERLVAAAPDHLRPLVVFLLMTGARLSEALYLDWRCVDLSARRVRFEKTKNGERRGVPLHPLVAAELAGLKHRDGAVFRRPDGLPYASREGRGGGQVKTAWSSMVKRAGLTDFTPHDCRHTFASWHYAANRNTLGLMLLGGWKSERMVARYAHLNPDAQQPEIDAILPGYGANWGKTRGGVTLISNFAKQVKG